MTRDFGSIIKQLLQTDAFYLQLLEDLLVQSGCETEVELRVNRSCNTIVIRRQLGKSIEPDDEGRHDP